MTEHDDRDLEGLRAHDPAENITAPAGFTDAVMARIGAGVGADAEAQIPDASTHASPEHPTSPEPAPAHTTIDHDLGEGGLSGAPLLPRSLEVVRRLRARLGEGPTVIGVGGISSIMDAELMLDAGADLLQAYTAFVYNGPAWPGRLNRTLATARRR